MIDSRTAIFERHRAHLLGLSYRMLGEMATAEDVVQEAWLRWERAAAEDVRNPRAWLSKTAMRLALDQLKSARARRETYVGTWLPEPILNDDLRRLTARTPEARAERTADLSLALLHVLERLTPEERAAFVLHDIFECGYPEIAAVLEKSEVACRKLVSRARAHVKAERPRFEVTKDEHDRLVARFAEAAFITDERKLAALFAEDIVFYSDGGGRVPAALNPVRGADRVSRLVAGLVRKTAEPGAISARATEINGRPGLLLIHSGALYAAFTIEAAHAHITAIYSVRNPEKLARIGRREHHPLHPHPAHG